MTMIDASGKPVMALPDAKCLCEKVAIYSFDIMDGLCGNTDPEFNHQVCQFFTIY